MTIAASPLSAARQQQLETVIKQSVAILHPKLNRILRPGVTACLGLSFHIQDGNLNHFKEIDEDRFGERMAEGLGGNPPAAAVVQGVLKSIAVTIRTKLEMVLGGDFFGFVLLTVDVRNGEHSVTCRSEKTHKIASPRVPT